MTAHCTSTFTGGFGFGDALFLRLATPSLVLWRSISLFVPKLRADVVERVVGGISGRRSAGVWLCVGLRKESAIIVGETRSLTLLGIQGLEM